MAAQSISARQLFVLVSAVRLYVARSYDYKILLGV